MGALYGSRRGGATITAYLIEGASGLPFFAERTGGFAVLAGPTGSYLLGFVGAAYLTGLGR
ncbi:MAG: biotin transporter BioY [Candidatus Zixiibacteriota bacterium]